MALAVTVSRDIPFAGASITPCDKVNAGAIRDSRDSPDSPDSPNSYWGGLLNRPQPITNIMCLSGKYLCHLVCFSSDVFTLKVFTTQLQL